MRLMLLHQKNFFLVKSCSYSEKLIQNHFTDVVLTGLQNENIGNKMCPISRLNSLFLEELLKNLSSAMFNKHEHVFACQVFIGLIVSCLPSLTDLNSFLCTNSLRKHIKENQ